MARVIKKPFEKLQTKFNNIVVKNPSLSLKGGNLKFQSKTLITLKPTELVYSKWRYYPTSEKKIDKVDFLIKIVINKETIELVSRSSPKPPNFIRYLVSLFRSNGAVFNSIIIGHSTNSIKDKALNITYKLYRTLSQINNEERQDETIRFKTRAATFLDKEFGISLTIKDAKIDWGARLQELLVSGKFTQTELLSLAEKLEPGDSTQLVIKKQVTKQVSWLLAKLEEILDEEQMSTIKAKSLGSSIFHYPKTTIKGPEHLMEKILTDYGQNTLFGVPALINTNKYVLHEALPRVQFDLLLIDNLGEVQVVELKRTDTILLDFDSQRNKFYSGSELSKAIAQTERYISSIMKDNDVEFKIDNLTVRNYINSQLGGLIHVETLRPTGLIIIGTTRTICQPYEELDSKIKNKFSRKAYNENAGRAYRELKDSHKNIKIVTYSELIESARLRLELTT